MTTEPTPEHDQSTVHDEPSDVEAVDGAVAVDGPDAVAVKLSPDAAEETGERLQHQSVRARGQRRLEKLPHKPEKR